jgi:hypothetical protein
MTLSIVAVLLSRVSSMLSVTYAECHIKALYAGCHYGECRYGECRSALETSLFCQ